MAERSDIKDPAIIIADRNYESYNTLEHIRKKGWHYLIRLREAAGILSNLPLPDGDFDLPVQIFLTRKQTNAVKALMKEHPGKYRFLPSKTNIEFLSKERPIFIHYLFASFDFKYLRIPPKRSLRIWTRIPFPLTN